MSEKTRSFFNILSSVLLLCFAINFFVITITKPPTPADFRQDGFITGSNAAALKWDVANNEEEAIDGYMIVDVDRKLVINVPKGHILNSSQYGDEYYWDFETQEGENYNLKLYSYKIKDHKITLSVPVNIKFTAPE